MGKEVLLFRNVKVLGPLLIFLAFKQVSFFFNIFECKIK